MDGATVLLLDEARRESVSDNGWEGGHDGPVWLEHQGILRARSALAVACGEFVGFARSARWAGDSSIQGEVRE